MDWAKIEEIAYGPLNLKPNEFWTLTLRELEKMADGYTWRLDNEWKRTAQLAAWITSSITGKRVSADDLYRGRPDKNKSRKKFEESKEFFNKAVGRKP